MTSTITKTPIPNVVDSEEIVPEKIIPNEKLHDDLPVVIKYEDGPWYKELIIENGIEESMVDLIILDLGSKIEF